MGVRSQLDPTQEPNAGRGGGVPRCKERRPPAKAAAVKQAAPLEGIILQAMFTTSSLRHRQPLPIKALGKGLCVFRFSKAEHHEVAVIAAQGVRERRRR